ncbi:hypothetical protein WJX79_008274 [Trebouxia sp. C0005]
MPDSSETQLSCLSLVDLSQVLSHLHSAKALAVVACTSKLWKSASDLAFRDLCISTGRNLACKPVGFAVAAADCTASTSGSNSSQLLHTQQQLPSVNWRGVYFQQSHALSFNGINDYVALPVGLLNLPTNNCSEWLCAGHEPLGLTIDLMVCAHQVPANPLQEPSASARKGVLPPAGGVLFGCQDREFDGVFDAIVYGWDFSNLPSYSVLGSGITEGCLYGASTPVYNCHSFHGLIDELRLWTRALQPYEVQQLAWQHGQLGAVSIPSAHHTYSSVSNLVDCIPEQARSSIGPVWIHSDAPVEANQSAVYMHFLKQLRRNPVLMEVVCIYMHVSLQSLMRGDHDYPYEPLAAADTPFAASLGDHAPNFNGVYGSSGSSPTDDRQSQWGDGGVDRSPRAESPLPPSASGHSPHQKPLPERSLLKPGLRKSVTRGHLHQRESRARKTTWIITNEAGVKSIFYADKRTIISKFKLGIPIRDMRLLDPNLLTSESGKILVRDNAIVFAMEHIRLIISATTVIIPRDGFEQNLLNSRFNALLEESIIEASHEKQHRESRLQHLREIAESDIDDDTSSDAWQHQVPPLPFELQVLEVVLGDVVALASQLARDLEAVVHPALDSLMKSTSTANLERVRKMKTRHQRLQTRVTTVREELQSFLEDDDDMMKMCLTHKMEQGQNQELVRAQGGSLPVNVPHSQSMRRASSYNYNTPRYHGPSSPKIDLLPADSRASDSQDMQGQMAESDGSEEAAEAVENLLESYFMQIDGTYDRLVSISEYIQDTEEYINIELDSSRNRLIRLELVINTATFSIAMYSLVAGVLGENLIIPDFLSHDVSKFWILNGSVLAFCILVFYLIILCLKQKRLM